MFLCIFGFLVLNLSVAIGLGRVLGRTVDNFGANQIGIVLFATVNHRLVHGAFGLVGPEANFPLGFLVVDVVGLEVLTVSGVVGEADDLFCN